MTDLAALQLGTAREKGGPSARDFFLLLKPRVMSIVVLTGAAGLVAAPVHLHPLLGFVAVLAIAVAAGAAGCLNMWYERELDARMTRTRDRPLPAGRVAPDEALAFGIALTVFAVMTMGLATNWFAAGLLAFTTFFYVVIYTIWLKPRTAQNIVIGGAAGAFPPMIGWAAATGDVSATGIALFAIIFFWTPPHFWALALLKCEEYRRAGIPMLPVTAGIRATKIQILGYTLLLLPVALLPYFLGAVGTIYAVGATALGIAFVVQAWRLLNSDTSRAAWRLFRFSLLHIAAIFVLVMVDVVR